MVLVRGKGTGTIESNYIVIKNDESLYGDAGSDVRRNFEFSHHFNPFSLFRIYLILLFCCLQQILSAQEKSLQGFIEITVAGEVDKPYNSIIFNLNGKLDPLPGIIIKSYGKTDTIPQGFIFTNANGTDTVRSPFVHIINVNEDMFHRLDSVIQKDSTSGDYDLLRDPISIRISLNGYSRHFLFGFKNFIQSLFRKIEQEFEGADKEEVHNVFASLLRRLS